METMSITPKVFYHMLIHYNQVSLNEPNLIKLINIFVTYHKKQSYYTGFVLDFLSTTDSLLKSILWIQYDLSRSEDQNDKDIDMSGITKNTQTKVKLVVGLAEIVLAANINNTLPFNATRTSTFQVNHAGNWTNLALNNDATLNPNPRINTIRL